MAWPLYGLFGLLALGGLALAIDEANHQYRDWQARRRRR